MGSACGILSSRRYTTSEADERDRNIDQIDSAHRWLHDVSLEGDDKRSPLLRWLQDAEQDNDNTKQSSRYHGCNGCGHGQWPRPASRLACRPPIWRIPYMQHATLWPPRKLLVVYEAPRRKEVYMDVLFNEYTEPFFGR